MRRTTLWLTAAAVAAASCVAVMLALREPPRSGPARAPAAAQAARSESAAAAPAPPAGEAPPPPTARDEARTLAAAARSAEAEEQALRAAILGVAADESLPLRAQLERYRAAARATAPSAPLEHPGMLAEAFLRTDAVQRELAALGPAERSRELAHIRRELGYAEEEIARMEEIDAWRESRWHNGLAYMQERARLTATFAGDALDEELRALRAEHFGHEAPTIEAEERDGFFRFERPRVYGRN
jgi:hypothetical protein